MRKPQVREEAAKRNLITATKKESMGICFVGKVGIRDFLSQFVETEPGPIVDQKGQQIGVHDGAIFYTIGQRHGLDVGGGLPYYVTHKDMEINTVYVTNDISDESLWTDTLTLTGNHWINAAPKVGHSYHVRTRHRAKTVNCEIVAINSSKVEVRLVDKIRASTPGQSAVLYDGEICIGGGIITV
jgi:tRNA-specific 2-thiouridylase